MNGRFIDVKKSINLLEEVNQAFKMPIRYLYGWFYQLSETALIQIFCQRQIMKQILFGSTEKQNQTNEQKSNILSNNSTNRQNKTESPHYLWHSIHVSKWKIIGLERKKKFEWICSKYDYHILVPITEQKVDTPPILIPVIPPKFNEIHLQCHFNQYL